MYQASGKAEAEGLLERTPPVGFGAGQVSRVVWMLGVTSLLTDVSSEMLTSILPLYLVFHLGLSPLSFGVVDGLQQGGSALTRVIFGLVADRFSSHKRVALLGYLASALSRIGLFLVGANSGGILGFTLLDRVGKGIRTSPRDAMIARSVPRAAVGLAFGVHRTFDTAGAALGPVVAVGVLYLLPSAYDAVFIVSFAFALVAVAVLVAFVPASPAREGNGATAVVSLAELLRAARDVRFLRLLLGVGLLGGMTLGDGFLYLTLQHALKFGPTELPLLFVATPAAYFVCAIPAGRLADRFGRLPVLLSGYLLLLGAYLVAMAATALPPVVALALVVLLLGGYYAATDGVTMALASTHLPDALMASGLGLVTTVNGLGRLVGSVLFGWLFARLGPSAALVPFSLGLALAIGASFVLLKGKA